MPCNDSQRKAWLEASKSDRQTQEELLRREFADAGWQAQRLLDAKGQASDFYFHAIQQIVGTSLAITGAYVL